ncbi:hypothetical protein IG631_14814 [Alternaria alternata]|nr:hypothetical protein IG631_14814 [Alternaria alternata]
MEVQPILLSREAQTEDQNAAMRYGSGTRKLQLFVHGHRGCSSRFLSFANSSSNFRHHRAQSHIVRRPDSLLNMACRQLAIREGV